MTRMLAIGASPPLAVRPLVSLGRLRHCRGLCEPRLEHVVVVSTKSTGGFTISNTNDYKKNIRKIMEDVSTH